jgi:hypothetical protein
LPLKKRDIEQSGRGQVIKIEMDFLFDENLDGSERQKKRPKTKASAAESSLSNRSNVIGEGEGIEIDLSVFSDISDMEESDNTSSRKETEIIDLDD